MAKKSKQTIDEDLDRWEEDEAPDYDSDADDEEADHDDSSDNDENVEESVDEMREIESKIESGEAFSASPSEASLLLKTRVLYSCPRCNRIFFRNKWIRDTITDIYTVRTELAYCDKCLQRRVGDFIGSIEMYDKQLRERKDHLDRLVRSVERNLENRQPFENILNVVERNEILYVFANTTRLTMEIARAVRQEIGGSIQYEWFDRNQYLRAKWFAEMQNRNHFKKQMLEAREKRFGLFSFED